MGGAAGEKMSVGSPKISSEWMDKATAGALGAHLHLELAELALVDAQPALALALRARPGGRCRVSAARGLFFLRGLDARERNRRREAAR